MGILDTLLKVSDVLEATGKVASYVLDPMPEGFYKVYINSVDVFEIDRSNSQEGLKKGLFLKKESMNTSFLLSYIGGMTGRYSIRLDLASMLENTLAKRKVLKGDIHMTETTDFLNYGGYAKKRLGKWIVMNKEKSADYYVLYRLEVFDCTGKNERKLEYSELHSLFIEDLSSDEYQSSTRPF